MGCFIYPLASGSAGNALLVASGRAKVLVDLGLSQRMLRARLRAACIAPEDIAAVLVTHTHGDHFSAAAAAFCLRHRTPIYSTRENLRLLAQHVEGFRDVAAAALARPIDGQVVEIEDIAVEAFDVPHDSLGRCVGFRMTVGGGRRARTVTVATDLGHVTAEAIRSFVDADAVVLESNHDPAMLRSSGRPPDLIRRIAGPYGHLSNAASAEAVAEILDRSHPGRIRHLVLAHLSRDCNTPRLALEAQAYAARRRAGQLHITAASQHETGPVIAI